MVISVRLSEKDGNLFKRYADKHGITVSELVRQSVLMRMEDDCDLQAYDKAMADFRADPVAFSLNEVETALGLQ